MFREMRLKDENAISKDQTEKIMTDGNYGVLAVEGDDGFPYAVPLNYFYQDGKVYFHGAKVGHKLDAVLKNEKVSFCVVAKGDIIPEEFNTLFLSAIGFGKAKIIENSSERQRILELILQKYSKGFMEGGKKYIKAQWDNVSVVEISVEHLTGKKGI